MTARWRAALIALWLALGAPLWAQSFPPLTGRFVDAAQLLPADKAAAIETKLAAIEQSTGRQVVVATIADMQGYALEDYGYRLGRAWGIGEKGKNTGIVMFLAPNNPPGQRGPRIEVGYGLEPIVTDAFASVVANSIMTPKLRQGDIDGALNAGIDAIAEQIKLTPEEAAKRAAELAAQQQQAEQAVDPGAFIFWLMIFFFVILPLVGRFGRGRRHRSGLGQAILWTAANAALNSRSGSDWDSGSSFGGGDGGGFSGGGGSFGGGGASGGW